MLAALLRAIAALSLPPLRRVVAIGLALTVSSFVALWLVLALLFEHLNAIAWAPLFWLLNVLGVAAVLFVSWLLFPAVATLILGFFLDRVAAAIEAVDYPHLPLGRVQPITETIRVTVRLMSAMLLLNLLAIPIYVFVPGINLFVFLLLNGYLFGREYFEVVALRRLDRGAATALRRGYATRVFVGGVIIAGLFAVPVVNLLAPVIATAFMVHVFHGLRRSETPALPT